MKKALYIFIGIYLTVMTVLGLIAMLNMRFSIPYDQQPHKYNVMLMISSIMAVLIVFILLIWRIVKFILVKLKIVPDDYFVYVISAPKSLEHMLWTRSGVYRRDKDPAEIKQSERKDKIRRE